MRYGDFVRQMPSGTATLAQRRSLADRVHIDIWLLAILLALTTYGLIVLYSASGRSIDTVYRQGRFFLIAYGVMFAIAQFDLERIKRFAPFAYCGRPVSAGAGALRRYYRQGRAALADDRRLSVSAVRDHEAGGADGGGVVSVGAYPAAAVSCMWWARWR